MIKVILLLVLMQSFSVQADVKHQIRFCAGKFCAATTSLTIPQQLELNQHFAEGNLRTFPGRLLTQNDKDTKLKIAKAIVSKIGK